MCGTPREQKLKKKKEEEQKRQRHKKIEKKKERDEITRKNMLKKEDLSLDLEEPQEDIQLDVSGSRWNYR